MTETELFAEMGDAYLSLIHLESKVDESLDRIAVCSAEVSHQLIHHLLQNGDSWRERLLALVLATQRGIDGFYGSLLVGIHKTGCISIVPMFAAWAVAVRDRGCEYDEATTASLDRDRWDGEVGFALDWFHHMIGIGDAPQELAGPNYGQVFSRHLEFYTRLNQAKMRP